MGHGQMLRVSKDLRARVSRVSRVSQDGCVIIRRGGFAPGVNGVGDLSALGDVTALTGSQGQAAARGLGMNLVMLPPGTRELPHFHAGRETAIYMVSGEAEVWHSAGLAKRSTVRAGDFLYIPPGTPHVAVNRADVTSIAVVARTQPPDGDAGDAIPIELPRHLAGLEALPVAARE